MLVFTVGTDDCEASNLFSGLLAGRLLVLAQAHVLAQMTSVSCYITTGAGHF